MLVSLQICAWAKINLGGGAFLDLLKHGMLQLNTVANGRCYLHQAKHKLSREKNKCTKNLLYQHSPGRGTGELLEGPVSLPPTPSAELLIRSDLWAPPQHVMLFSLCVMLCVFCCAVCADCHLSSLVVPHLSPQLGLFCFPSLSPRQPGRSPANSPAVALLSSLLLGREEGWHYSPGRQSTW